MGSTADDTQWPDATEQAEMVTRRDVSSVAADGREDMLIRVASQLGAAEPWAHRRPL